MRHHLDPPLGCEQLYFDNVCLWTMLLYTKKLLNWATFIGVDLLFLQIDFAIATLYQQMTERQKKFAKYAEQVHKIQEMHSVLNRIKMNVDQTTALMERLNSVLPPEEQLEPFSMKTK